MPTHNHPTTGDWSVTAYNTGTYSHSLYITFEVDLYVPPPHRLVLAPASALSNPPPITSPIWGIDAST